MKVLHILNTNGFSGAENVVCQIIEVFRKDTEMEMVYVSRDGPIREALFERDISFCPVSSLSITELKRVIRLEKPDVIHAHDMRASVVAAMTCGNTRLISQIHNNAFESRRISIKSVAYLYAAQKARHIFWVSNAALHGYRFYNFVKSKSSVLYNVIDTEQLQRKADSAPESEEYDIVFVGRLTYPKNPERLLHVLQLAMETEQKLTAAIIGNGELMETVQHLVEQAGLSKRISIKGFMNNPYGILKNAKVMLMTSRWEGLPMCALESLALGTPIVSTPTDGLKEIIRQGRNGYLFDDDRELAKALAHIFTDQSHREKLSKQAMKLSREYNDLPFYKRKLEQAYYS